MSLPDASGPADFTLAHKRVWVTGHRGMVGSALLKRLVREGCVVLTSERNEVDLRRQSDVEAWMGQHRPEAIFMAAATVGGILANGTRPADFIYDNLMIEANIIHAASRMEVQKLLFLGSSCIYPKAAKCPITEETLLTGALEPSNEWYAIAKIAGIKLCQAYRRQHGCNFISAMPANLYGPGDNYDLSSGHVAAAMIMKVEHAVRHKSRVLEIWGSGTPRREFLFVDDLADALVFLMRNYSDEMPINVGTGVDISIKDLAALIANIAGWKGEFTFDRTKPDGVQRKLMDVSRLNAMGWRSQTPLEDGLRSTYAHYVNELQSEMMAHAGRGSR